MKYLTLYIPFVSSHVLESRSPPVTGIGHTGFPGMIAKYANMNQYTVHV